MAKRPNVAKEEKSSFLAMIKQEIDSMTAAEIAKEIGKIAVPVNDQYHMVSRKAHPEVLRACAYVARCERAREKFEQQHDDMHDEMRRTGSDVRVPEHRQAHLDILRSGVQNRMAEMNFFTETHLRHPEFMDIQNRAEIGTDGSIGWVTPQLDLLRGGRGEMGVLMDRQSAAGLFELLFTAQRK